MSKITNTWTLDTHFRGIHKVQKRRRHVCRHCNYVYTSRELVESDDQLIPDELISPKEETPKVIKPPENPYL